MSKKNQKLATNKPLQECGTELVKLTNIQPGERVLDVGCGCGCGELMTNDLSSSDAIDLDADPSMIAKAQQQFPHLQFIQSDVCEFDLEEPVDVIFNNAALHWVGNENNAAERAVVCMARALKPGGRFVVEFGGKGNVKTDWPKYGIKVTTALLFDRPTILEGAEEGLLNWLDMFGNKFFEKMSKDEIENAQAELLLLLRPQLFDGEQWTADYRCIRI